jgi:hypothetical protein
MSGSLDAASAAAVHEKGPAKWVMTWPHAVGGSHLRFRGADGLHLPGRERVHC